MTAHLTTQRRLGELLPGSAGAWSGLLVSGISSDSRSTKEGDLFFSLARNPRARVAHVQESTRRGAVASVVTAGHDAPACRDDARPVLTVPSVPVALGDALGVFYEHPARALTVYGVTGTDGKTSVCSFIAQFLEYLGMRCGSIGTLGCYLGTSELASSSLTTPDAVYMYASLARLRALHADAVVLELSSHALKQQRVHGIDFDVAVFTNLSAEHMDYHPDMDDYLHSKSLLFRRPELRRAVLNADDSNSAYLRGVSRARECLQYTVAGNATPGPVTAAALDPGNTVAASALRGRMQGMRARISSPWGEGDLDTGVPGHFNLCNVLAAIAALLSDQVSLQDLLSVAHRLRLPVGRMQYVQNELGMDIVVDFAHTANALRHVLRSLRASCRGRLWCVFGCGGGRDPGKRPLMGQYAAEFADCVVLTDDNPRHEPSSAIIDDILSGIKDPAKVTVLNDRASAIQYCLGAAEPGDCVLIAGKGHERYIHATERTVPFNDVEEVTRYLAELNVPSS